MDRSRSARTPPIPSRASRTRRGRTVATGLRDVLDGRSKRFQIEYPCHSDVEQRWFSVRAYPSREGLAVYFQDVTQVVRNREALRQSERELVALAESMPQMVWTARPDGYVTYLNQRCAEYSGLSLDESRGDGWMR